MAAWSHIISRSNFIFILCTPFWLTQGLKDHAIVRLLTIRIIHVHYEIFTIRKRYVPYTYGTKYAYSIEHEQNGKFVMHTYCFLFSWSLLVDLCSLQRTARKCFSRWILGVHSVKAFAKNLSDLYYEYTIVVHDMVSGILYYTCALQFSITILLHYNFQLPFSSFITCSQF